MVIKAKTGRVNSSRQEAVVEPWQALMAAVVCCSSILAREVLCQEVSYYNSSDRLVFVREGMPLLAATTSFQMGSMGMRLRIKVHVGGQSFGMAGYSHAYRNSSVRVRKHNRVAWCEGGCGQLLLPCEESDGTAYALLVPK